MGTAPPQPAIAADHNQAPEPGQAGAPALDLQTPPDPLGRQAVYVARVPANFQPTGFRELPPTFHGARLIAASLDQPTAAALARAFNEGQVDARMKARLWAFLAEHPDTPPFGTGQATQHQIAYRNVLAAIRHLEPALTAQLPDHSSRK